MNCVLFLHPPSLEDVALLSVFGFIEPFLLLWFFTSPCVSCFVFSAVVIVNLPAVFLLLYQFLSVVFPFPLFFSFPSLYFHSFLSEALFHLSVFFILFRLFLFLLFCYPLFLPCCCLFLSFQLPLFFGLICYSFSLGLRFPLSSVSFPSFDMFYLYLVFYLILLCFFRPPLVFLALFSSLFTFLIFHFFIIRFLSRFSLSFHFFHPILILCLPLLFNYLTFFLFGSSLPLFFPFSILILNLSLFLV